MNINSDDLVLLFKYQGFDYYKYGDLYIKKHVENAAIISFEECFLDYMYSSKNALCYDLNLSYLRLYHKLNGYDPNEVVSLDDFELLSEMIYEQEQLLD